MQEILNVHYRGLKMGPFVITSAAPEDHIELHPLMYGSILGTISAPGVIDIVKSTEEFKPRVVADIAWLLEAKLDTGAPLYVNHIINGGKPILTTDVDDAIRFSRREDAQRIADDIAIHMGVLTPTEHVWV